MGYNENMNEKDKQNIIAELLQELKNGVPEEEVKKKYIAVFGNDHFDGKDSWTLSAETKVNKNNALESTGYQEDENPLILFAQENGALRALLDNVAIDIENEDEVGRRMLKDEFARLTKITNHYQKKEAFLFPLLEKLDVKTLADVHDKDEEVLSLIKELNEKFKNDNPHIYKDKISHVVSLIRENIVYENKFLLPILDEHLSDEELHALKIHFDLIGYCLIRYKK